MPSNSKEYAREWKEKNREKVREQERARHQRPEVKERGLESTKQSRLKFQDKYLARTKLRDAVRRGKIVRQPCEVCGESNGQGHHDDYAKPLEVRWLYAFHHRQFHR